eukprot:1160616-Pelagomonas_calceolata.AAC.11
MIGNVKSMLGKVWELNFQVQRVTRGELKIQVQRTKVQFMRILYFDNRAQWQLMTHARLLLSTEIHGGRLEVAREGTKKTVFQNFMDLCKAMNRQQEHDTKAVYKTTRIKRIWLVQYVVATAG